MLGGCRIERLLGRGGMGAVYLGTQVDLERPVAIKLLAGEIAENPQFLARFEREAKTVAQLGHPNVVHIHFTGAHAGHRYLVMEFVEGRSLAHLLRERGPLRAEAACRLVRQAADALAAAWARGIVHRDIKPDNLLVTPGGG